MKKVNMKKQDIIEQAYIHLKDELGKAVHWREPMLQGAEKGYDAVFALQNKVIYVEAKSEVRPNQVEKLVELKDKTGNLLVVANYITSNTKQMLKERELNYIDRAGNIWFRFESIYIHIQGLPNKPPAEDRINRAFTKAGIKVVFQILCDPSTVHTTYRAIAKKAGVALGTVPKVIQGLKDEGFLLRKKKGEWMLADYDQLLNRWQEVYTNKLKPTLFVKRYRPTDKNFYANWKKLVLKRDDLWGSEPAGDLLTHDLKPEIFTLYSKQLQQKLMKTYHWVPDTKGDIYIYNKFWKYPVNDTDTSHVPTPLVYADLMGTGETRCIKTATIIYEQYLQKH